MPYSHEQYRTDTGILMRLSHEKHTTNGLILQNIITDINFAKSANSQLVATNLYVPTPAEVVYYSSVREDSRHEGSPLIEDSVFFEHDSDTFIRRVSKMGRQIVKCTEKWSVSCQNYPSQEHGEVIEKLNQNLYAALQNADKPEPKEVSDDTDKPELHTGLYL